jgi:hypothetical protein
MKASLKLEAIGDDESAPIRQRPGSPRRPLVGHSPLYRRLARPSSVRAVREYAAELARQEGPPPPRQWCAELIGVGADGELLGARLRGKRDYTDANGIGSRGVSVYYLLESGRLYEVSAPRTWRHTEHYYCTVTDAGAIERLTEEEVRQRLLKRD